MKTIEIEDDLYKYILNNIEAFGETPSQILRRLLALSEEKKQIEVAPQHKKTEVENTALTRVELMEQEIVEETTTRTENNKHFHQGVKLLFDDSAFTSESIITNKF